MARIMVVDDEWLTRLQVNEMLEDLGYEVVGMAETGKEAIEMARDLEPDLILMDVVMPGELDGIDAAKQITSEQGIPIIFISGYGEPELIEKAKTIEPFGYVMKPFDEKEVRAFIEIALHNKGMVDKLKKSEDRYRELVEGTDDIIVRTNSVGTLTYINKSVKNNFGVKPEQLIGMSALSFVYSEDSEKTEKRIKTCIRNQESGIGFENRIFSPLIGELCHIRWTINTHFDENSKFVGLSAIGKDFSTQKKLEKAISDASKLKAFSVLTGGIAHDFGNIMATIVGNIGLARMDMNPASKAYKELQKAEKASFDTKKLVSRLLKLSENELPATKCVSMVDQFSSMVNLYQEEFERNCRLTLPCDISPVDIDLEQMGHVIHNVLENAKAATTGKDSINIVCENVDVQKEDIPELEDGKFVKISIQDPGHGMPQKTLSKALDPYFSTKEAGIRKGMGLGLAECNAIVKNHGGLMTLTSQLGSGTTVSIFLPTSKTESQALTASVKSPQFSENTDGIKSAPTKQKILLMEENEMLRNVGSSLISRIGYEVEMVSDGAQAVEAYRREMETKKPFDAVILNLNQKTGMGGIETLERLLEIDPSVKAILNTGQSNHPVVRNLREHGFRAVLIKPFTFDELKTVLHEAALK